MAEILIKNIEMPRGNNVLIIDKSGTVTKFNLWTGKREYTDPLKVKAGKLPHPHGDLIDRNEFFENDKGKSVIVSCNAEFRAVSELYEKIRNAKTVIEAST